MPIKNNFYKKGFTGGFTLMELVVGISILIIIMAFAVFSFSGIKNSQALKNSAQDTVSSINKARAESFASVSSSAYGVHFQSDKVVVFKGTAYSVGNSSNETVNILSPATISSISLSGGGSDVYFNRLTGVPSKTGTVVVTAGTKTKTITISALGGVSAN